MLNIMCNNCHFTPLWVLCRGQACLLSMRAVTGSHVADCWCTSELRHRDILSATSPWIVTADVALHMCSPVKHHRGSLSIYTEIHALLPEIYGLLKSKHSLVYAHMQIQMTNRNTGLLTEPSCHRWNVSYRALCRNTYMKGTDPSTGKYGYHIVIIPCS